MEFFSPLKAPFEVYNEGNEGKQTRRNIFYDPFFPRISNNIKNMYLTRKKGMSMKIEQDLFSAAVVVTMRLFCCWHVNSYMYERWKISEASHKRVVLVIVQ